MSPKGLLTSPLRGEPAIRLCVGERGREATSGAGGGGGGRAQRRELSHFRPLPQKEGAQGL